MQHLLVADLVRRPEIQTLARPAVDCIVHPLDLVVRHPGEVGPLREALPQQPAGVLVGAALSRMVREGETERRPRRLLDPFGLGELLAPVRRHGLGGAVAGECPDLDVGYAGLRVRGGLAALQQAAPAVDERDEAGAGPLPTTVSTSQLLSRERPSSSAGLSDMGRMPGILPRRSSGPLARCLRFPRWRSADRVPLTVPARPGGSIARPAIAQ